MQSNPANRLQKFIDIVFHGNQSKFADAAELHATAITRWIRGGAEISQKSALKLERLTGISAAWLMNEAGEMYADNTQGLALKSINYKVFEKDLFVKEPLIKYVANNKYDDIVIIYESQNFDGIEMINELYKLMNLNKNDVITKITSDRFLDFNVAAGDIVIIEKSEKYADYAIVVVKIDNAMLLKRYRKYNNQNYLTDNDPFSQPQNIDERMQILGKIKATIKLS